MTREEHLELIRRQHPDECYIEHVARLDHRVKHLRRRELEAKAMRAVKRAERFLPWIVMLCLLVLVIRSHAQTTNQNVNIARVGGTAAVAATGLPVFCVSGCSATTNPSFGAAFPATGLAVGAKFGANMVNLGADASSNLLVNCAVGCGASGFTDNSAFTVGTSTITNIGGLFDDTPPAAIVAGKAAAARITANRGLHVNLRNQAGTELGTAGAPIRTDPTGSTAQPVNGTVTANQGTANTAANAWPAKVTDGTNTAAVKAASTAAAATDPAVVVAVSPNNTIPVSGTVTATVSGTVTANQGTANTAANAWPAKVTDGTTVAGVIVGTTALKVDTASVAGTATATAAAGVQKVGVVGGAGTSLETTAGVLDENIKNVGNAAVSTAASGVQKVGIVGNAGAAVDAANNAAAPANVIATGLETATQGTTQPTAATAGNVRRPVQSTDGAQYVRLGGPVSWSCGLDNIAATLTQCQAAPAGGLKLYLTDIIAVSTTATAGQFLVRTGTGTNCGTGTASLLPSAATVVRLPYPANTAATPTIMSFSTPIASPAASAICVLAVATNTLTIQMNGYTAP